MDLKKLPETKLVDLYGEADTREKEASKEKKSIKEVIIEKGMDAEGVHSGAAYNLTVSIAPKVALDPAKILKKIGKDKFLEVCTVSMEAVKKYLALEDIDACVGTVTPITRFIAKKK